MGARRYSGWNEEGLTRFNVLYDKVKRDRERFGEEADQRYKKYCIDRENVYRKKRKRASVHASVVAIRCDDMSDLI